MIYKLHNFGEKNVILYTLHLPGLDRFLYNVQYYFVQKKKKIKYMGYV